MLVCPGSVAGANVRELTPCVLEGAGSWLGASFWSEAGCLVSSETVGGGCLVSSALAAVLATGLPGGALACCRGLPSTAVVHPAETRTSSALRKTTFRNFTVAWGFTVNPQKLEAKFQNNRTVTRDWASMGWTQNLNLRENRVKHRFKEP